MKVYLIERWEALRRSFWFIPSLLTAGGLALAVALLHLDQHVSEDWFRYLGLTYQRGPEGARALLSAIASSMMTIASLTFSITIVTLQLASSQFGPRLLRNFIRDPANQLVLGTFVATFAHCLMVLRSVNGTGDHQFVPHVAVATSIALALASLGVLIYFIHHVAQSIQAEYVVARVGRELGAAIERLYPEKIGERIKEVPSASEEAPLGAFGPNAFTIKSPESNYLQSVDSERLFDLAVEQDTVMRIEFRPGQFVIKGAGPLTCRSGTVLDEAAIRVVQGAFYFGPQRTLTQDLEFAIDQLVEIAVRALSPGINDPFTAIACVDRLAAAVSELAPRRITGPRRYDEHGQLRIVAVVSTPAGLIDAAFHQIRQAARSNAAVTLRLLELLEILLMQSPQDSFRDALHTHATLIHDGSQLGLPEGWDRDEASRRFARIAEATPKVF